MCSVCHEPSSCWQIVSLTLTLPLPHARLVHLISDLTCSSDQSQIEAHSKACAANAATLDSWGNNTMHHWEGSVSVHDLYPVCPRVLCACCHACTNTPPPPPPGTWRWCQWASCRCSCWRTSDCSMERVGATVCRHVCHVLYDVICDVICDMCFSLARDIFSRHVSNLPP